MNKNEISRKIREKVNQLQKEYGDQSLTYQGPEMLTKKQFNPDIDKEAFSRIRKKYEDLLKELNINYIVDTNYRDSKEVKSLVEKLNRDAQNSENQSQNFIKAIVSKICRKIAWWGIGDQIQQFKEYNSTNTQLINNLLNQLNFTFAAQNEFNAQIALFGQQIVPVMDEKVRYAFETLDGIISENVKLLSDRSDILHEGLDRKQTEVLNWLHNTTTDFSNMKTDFNRLRTEMTRSLLLHQKKLEKVIVQSNHDDRVDLNHPEMNVLGDYSYYQFENQNRGSEETIKEKLKHYLNHFYNQSPVLDVGCGRGEFLELLQAQSIESYGIDLNHDMVEIAKSKNLNVEHADLISFLSNSKDNQWGGIFSSQVVEHLTNEQLSAFFELAIKKIKPGGIFFFETINTASPYALVEHFYKDPTHQQPRHPSTYEFLAEMMGFTDCQLKYVSKYEPAFISQIKEYDQGRLQQISDSLPAIINGLLDFSEEFYGYSDFYVIAFKSE